jgi:hypothetical protein
MPAPDELCFAPGSSMGSIMSSWALSPSGMAASTMSSSLWTGLMLSFILELAARACPCGWHWSSRDLCGIFAVRHESFYQESKSWMRPGS